MSHKSYGNEASRPSVEDVQVAKNRLRRAGIIKALQKSQRKNRALKLQDAWATLSRPESGDSGDQFSAVAAAVQTIAKAAKGPPPKEKVDASLPQLLWLLRGPGPESTWADRVSVTARRQAGRVLEWYGRKASAHAAEIALAVADGDVAVRCWALRALARQGKEAAGQIPAVEEALSDKDMAVQCLAIGTLARMGDAAEHLVSSHLHIAASALRSSDVEVRRAAAFAFLQRGKQAADFIVDVVGALSDPDRGVRRLVANSLYRMGRHCAAHASELGQTLQDTDVSVRRWAARAIERIAWCPTSPVRDIVGAVVHDSDASVRKWALLALIRQSSGAASYAETLAPALRDPDEGVRCLAFALLGCFGNDYAWLGKVYGPSLVEALKSHDVEVKRSALLALGVMQHDLMNPHACALCEVLREARFDKDQIVRRGAEQVLLQYEDLAEFPKKSLEQTGIDDASRASKESVLSVDDKRRPSSASACSDVSSILSFNRQLSDGFSSDTLQRQVSNSSQMSHLSDRVNYVTETLSGAARKVSKSASKAMESAKELSWDAFFHEAGEIIHHWWQPQDDAETLRVLEEGRRCTRTNSRRACAASGSIIVPTATGGVFAKREQYRRRSEKEDVMESTMAALVLTSLLVMGMNTGSLVAELNVMLEFLKHGSFGYIFMCTLGFPIYYKSLSSFATGKFNRRNLRVAWKMLYARKLTLEQVKHGHKCASRLWADSGLVILSPCPALMVTIFALCADPKFDAPDLQFQRAKMFICMVISASVCGKNLNMHDHAFITWTGSASTEHFHLLMRISEVLLRVATTGLTADLIAAMWPFGDNSTSMCTAIVLCFEAAFWYRLLKKHFVSFSALDRIDALGAGMVLTFVDPFYFGNEWKHLNFKRANRVYLSLRLMQPPVVLILFFILQTCGWPVGKSMVPLVIVVMICSWCVFGVCSSIVTTRSQTLGVTNQTHGTGIHLARSIVDFWRRFDFFESWCPGPIVKQLHWLADDFILHHHRHHHRNSSVSFGQMAEPLLVPTAEEESDEISSSSDSDEDEEGADSESCLSSSSSSSSSSSKEVAEAARADSSYSMFGASSSYSLLDAREEFAPDSSYSVMTSSYSLLDARGQFAVLEAAQAEDDDEEDEEDEKAEEIVKKYATTDVAGVLSSTQHDSSTSGPEVFVLSSTVRHRERTITSSEGTRYERTRVDASTEDPPHEGSKRGDGTPARVQTL